MAHQKTKTLGPIEPPDRSPIRLLTAGYIVALLIIAGMSFSIHVIIDQVIAEQNSSAVVVSARQARVTQRIALQASEYLESPDALERQQLEDSINLLERSHEALLHGDKGMNIPAEMPPHIREIFFGMPYDLDRQVKGFLEQARALLDTPAKKLSHSNEHYRYIVEMSKGPLLMALEGAITGYEVDSISKIARLQSYQRVALAVIFATLIAEALLIFMPLVRRIREYADMLEEMALTDGLTGMDNYRSFMLKAVKELHRSTRLKQPLCIAILDLDHFKQVNDKYGHNAGDAVLKAFADIVHNSKRVEDEFGRLGGEEFGLLLPHTTLSAAHMVTDRIRRMVETTPMPGAGTEKISVTVSIGLAELDPSAQTLDSVLHAADEALYRAKQSGRNRVEVSKDFTTDSKVVRLETQRS